MTRRFRQTMKGSFFGDFVYNQIIPARHFLMQLDKTVDWEPFTAVLVASYKGKAERGEAPYNSVMILKMLVLAYVYGISERQTEDFCTYYLPAKAFVGLGLLAGRRTTAPCASSNGAFSIMAGQRPMPSCST